MNYNYNNLRSQIIKVYGNQLNFSKATGIPNTRISGVLNNRIKLTIPEMELWCVALQIPVCDIASFFLVHEVGK